MSNVVVVATFKAAEGNLDEVLAGITALIEQTHEEAGCVSYALHRDVNDDHTLVLIERWTSQVALESHMQQPYMADLGSAFALLAEPPRLHFCTPEPVGDSIKGAL